MKTLIFLVICFLKVLSISCNSDDIFASFIDLQHLLETERVFIRDLESYIERQEKAVEFLRKKLMTFRVEHEEADINMELYVSNPLNAFLLIKRLTMDMDLISTITLQLAEDFMEQKEGYEDTLKTVNDDDLNGASLAFVRLQKTYHLETSALSKGEIDGVKYRRELSSHDCFIVGQQILESNSFNDLFYAVEWLQESLAKFEKYFDENELSRFDILINLAKAFNATNQIKDAKHTLTQALNENSNNPDAINFMGEIDERLHMLDMLNNPRPEFDEQFELYSKACRDISKQNPKLLSKLKCRFIGNTQFSKIAPLKAEEVNLEPYILLFHEVVSDSEINVIKELARPMLYRAKIVGDDGSGTKSSIRTSKVAWLNLQDHKYITDISNRVEDMTGLSTKFAEPLQVQSYGIGGHYELHLDALIAVNDPGVAEHGNRIATILFYLSNVELGGATVFPDLNVNVKPKKGSAVYWHNLDPAGGFVWTTRHAACPVLIGNKLAANKWLHDFDQELRRPCPKGFIV